MRADTKAMHNHYHNPKNHPPSFLSLSLPALSILISSSVNRSEPFQLALLVLFLNRSRLSLNISSICGLAGGPNISSALAFFSCSSSIRLSSGLCAHSASIAPFDFFAFSSSDSSSLSVGMSSSSIFSPFTY